MSLRQTLHSLAATTALLITGAGAATATDTGIDADSGTTATDRRIAVVLVNFTDDAIDSSTTFRTKVRDMYFGGTSLAAYYREASDGRTGFAPLAGQPDVLGPWTIDMAAKCDSSAMLTATRAALVARGIDATEYDNLAIWFPNSKAGCGWGGLGQQPGTVTWMPHFGSVSGVVHELGHNLGYRHLGAVTCTAGTLTSCVSAGYRGSSPMGGGGYATGLAPSELMHSGWLSAGHLASAPQPGRYTLTPLHASASVTGTRVLEIHRDSTDRLLVSYRRTGNTIDTGVGEQVQLHLTATGRYHTANLVDPSAGTTGKDDADLNPGSSITDATSGYTVRTESVGDRATVGITWAGRFTGAGGKCLDVDSGSTTDGTAVQLWTCNGTAAQRWSRSGDGTVRALGKCLDVDGGGTTAGTRVHLWTCHGGANQQWVATADGALRNPNSGLCLDAVAGSTADGTRIQLWTCQGTANQQWRPAG